MFLHKFLHNKSFVSLAFLVLASFTFAAAQENSAKQKTSEKSSKKEKKDSKSKTSDANKNVTAEQVAESAVVIYGGLGGRENLKQIRKTAFERGKISVTNSEGVTEQANYERRILRGDTLEKERIRFDQEFPSAKYALVFASDKIFGLYNDSVFTPRENASKSFENQI